MTRQPFSNGTTIVALGVSDRLVKQFFTRATADAGFHRTPVHRFRRVVRLHLGRLCNLFASLYGLWNYSSHMSRSCAGH
jgi:hypothetical protein